MYCICTSIYKNDLHSYFAIQCSITFGISMAGLFVLLLGVLAWLSSSCPLFPSSVWLVCPHGLGTGKHSQHKICICEILRRPRPREEEKTMRTRNEGRGMIRGIHCNYSTHLIIILFYSTIGFPSKTVNNLECLLHELMHASFEPVPDIFWHMNTHFKTYRNKKIITHVCYLCALNKEQ